MRTFLLSFAALAAVSLVAGGCSTTVRTDDGHAVSAGVHAR
jgi:uncharacterized protein YceK